MALRLRRWVGRVRYGTTTGLPRDQEGLIHEWVDRAHPHTAVEQIDDPKGFVALCAPARGAIACGYSEQEAIDEMRSVLFGWAYFSVVFGQDLPTLPSRTDTR